MVTVGLVGGAIGAGLILLGIVGGFVFPDRPLALPAPPSVAPAPSVAAQPTAPSQKAPEPTGLSGLFRSALERSRAVFQGRFDELFGGKVDDVLFDELEETLLVADVGVDAAMGLTDVVRKAARDSQEPAFLRKALHDATVELLERVHAPFEPPDKPLLVILVVGVNGSGKTTTIGKLAARFKGEGKKVLLAAGDTYRAAAVSQLAVWAERAGAEFVSGEDQGDPGAVVYNALESAKAKGCDVVIIDTAGRLQTVKPLMEQLAKLRRVIQKHVEDGPHETLLVLDGTMGQNGLSQARLFHEATPLTGVVVTKLDGSAKGGMVLTIASDLELPVKLIGIGEGVEDLRPFEPRPFVDALMGPAVL